MTRATTRSAPKRLRLTRGPAAIAFVAAVLILALGGWQILRARAIALDEANETIRNLTSSLTQHAARSIEAVDLILGGLVDRIEGGALKDLPRFKAYLNKRSKDVVQSRNLIVLDENGDWLAASSPEPYSTVRNSDREYFIWHRDHSDQVFHIGDIIVSRFDGQQIIPVTRRWNKPDGSFGGVIVAAVDPNYFQRFYERLGIGVQGVIALVSDDHRFLARQPFDRSLVNKSFPNLAIFREGLSKSRRGLLGFRSVVDGTDRIAAFEHLDKYPLTVLAARGVDEVLMPWREESIFQGVMLFAVSTVLIGLGLGLNFHQRRTISAEEEIRTSEVYHRAILDAANDAFVSIHATGMVTAWNASAERLFGHSADEAIGRPLAVLIVPARFREAHERGMARYLSTGRQTVIGKRLELIALRRDGTEFPIELTISVAGAAQDLSFHAFIQDISERVRRDQALRQSETLHRLLSENSGDMIAVKSTFEGARSYVSQACLTVVGWTPEEFAALPASQYVHPDDLDRVRAEYAGLTAVCPFVTSIHRVRHKLGHWIWAEAGFRLAGAGTEDERVIATSRDVTARRDAEEALHASEARYRLLAETSTDMIVLADLDSLKRYVSPASREILGYEPEELLGTRAGEMVHPEDSARLAGAIAGLQDGSVERTTSTHRFLRKDGTYVWVEAQCRLIRSAVDAAPTGYIALVRDVSERVRQAEELRSAKEKAEAATRAKSEFLASMSHELRTPLNSIIGFSGLMLDSSELKTPTMRRYARLVQDASTTLLSIVNDVLDVSKLEEGNFDLDPHPFSPRDLLEGSAALLRTQAEAKGLSIHLEADSRVPQILIGDDARLRQILLNLLSNAVKFTAKGMVWLQLDLESKTDDIARLRFTVMDTGIGIPQDKRHRLFQRFSQVDSSTSRQFGGTGLGLSICKSLVEIMGGRIEVESTEGEGSTFLFTLDLPIAATECLAPVQAATDAVTESSRSALILLAEDVEMNQELVVAMLTRWGHIVDVVADGAAAIDAVMRNSYDLVLMDIQMPVMDGLEATRRIRRLGPDFQVLPIIAMTANVMAHDIERCRAAGADSHIGKPFVPEKLRSAVEHWSLRQRTERSNEDTTIAPPVAAGDRARLDELQAMFGGPALVSLLRKFVTEIDGRLRQDVQATGAWQRIRSDAHMLVSSAGMLGYKNLSEKCQALEEICISPNPDTSKALPRLHSVHQEFVRVRFEVGNLIAELHKDKAA